MLIIIRNTFLVYLAIHCFISLISLLICIEDIDHQEIMCPRMNHQIKLMMGSVFKPLIPTVLDYLLQKILEQDHVIINILIFSGLMMIFIIPIYTFFYLLTQTPDHVQKILTKICRIFLYLIFAIWFILYFSGIGINKIFELLHLFYQNPSDYESYTENIKTLYYQRQQEILEYYF